MNVLILNEEGRIINIDEMAKNLADITLAVDMVNRNKEPESDIEEIIWNTISVDAFNLSKVCLERLCKEDIEKMIIGAVDIISDTVSTFSFSLSIPNQQDAESFKRRIILGCSDVMSQIVDGRLARNYSAQMIKQFEMSRMEGTMEGTSE